MNSGLLARRERARQFSDRLALRFALNARPTASQGEAPARAIGKTKFQEEMTKHSQGFWIRPSGACY